MSAKAHHIRFYGRDWRADVRLRKCGFAARGLWADLIALMIDATDRHGYLLMDGRAMDAADVAKALGCGRAQRVQRLLDELERHGVFSRVGSQLDAQTASFRHESVPNRCIFCRRMVRDLIRDAEARAHGTRGGNPALTERSKPFVPSNPGHEGVNPTVFPIPIPIPSPNAETSPSALSPMKELFDIGVRLLAKGRTEAAARSLIGKARKDLGDERLAVVLAAAVSKSDPAAYIMGAINKAKLHVVHGAGYAPMPSAAGG
jgi:hypothetical protein